MTTKNTDKKTAVKKTVKTSRKLGSYNKSMYVKDAPNYHYVGEKRNGSGR